MNNQFHEYIIAELREQGKRLDIQNATLVRLTASVEEHVRRTNLLEQQIVPLKAHVALINSICKIATALAGIVLFLKTSGLLALVLH